MCRHFVTDDLQCTQSNANLKFQLDPGVPPGLVEGERPQIVLSRGGALLGGAGNLEERRRRRQRRRSRRRLELELRVEVRLV